MSAVSYELDGRVGILTLNRPDSLNAVNPDMVAGLLAASARAADDPVARAVVVRGQDPMAPRELLTLTLPTAAQPVEAPDEPSAPELNPFERGPEITEVR